MLAGLGTENCSMNDLDQAQSSVVEHCVLRFVAAATHIDHVLVERHYI
jgi:hypothetical protein